MSDSSCSNCDDFDCKFRGYSYNCYKQEVEDIQKHLSKADIPVLEETRDKLDAVYRLTGNDTVWECSNYITKVIDLYNGE